MSIDLRTYRQAPKAKRQPVPESTRTNWWNKEISLFGTGLSMKKKEAFFSEFGVLLNAGLDFITALDLVTEGQKGKDLLTFDAMRQAIIGGASLSAAMEQSGRFKPYDVYSVQIAEESGRLEDILRELASFYNKNVQHSRLLTSTLSYPALVVIVAGVSLSFLLNFLVPMFSDVYKRLHQTLPGITMAIIQASALFSKYSGKALVLLGAVAVGGYLNRSKVWFRSVSSRIIMRLPVFGSLVSMIYLNRFCLAMSFLTNSKVPVLEALRLVRKMVGFYPLETAIDQIETGILKGKPLHEGMRAFRIFPKRMLAMVKVGEEVNRLDMMFGKLADQYGNEAEYRIKTIGSLIEPALIVFLAIVVGIVLVAMYLPIFKLVTNFGI